MTKGLSELGTILETMPEFQRLLGAASRCRLTGKAQVSPEGTAFTLSTLWSNVGLPTLVVTPRPEDARTLYDQLIGWAGDDNSILHFPETETLPFERLVSDSETTRHRLRTLATMLNPEGRPPLVVASTTATAQKTIARGTFESARHKVSLNDQLNLEHTLDTWHQLGYQFESMASAPGSVSRRGGILDIYPIGARAPARIELWGDKVDSIRLFDPETQRSTEMIDAIEVTPAQETLPGLVDKTEIEQILNSMDFSNCTGPAQDRIMHELDLLMENHEIEELGFYSGLFNKGSLLDYFPDNGLLVKFHPSAVAEAAQSYDHRANDLRHVKELRGDLPTKFPSSHLLWPEVQASMSDFGHQLYVTQWSTQESTGTDSFIMPFTSAPNFNGNTPMFVEETDQLAKDGHRVLAVTSVPNRLSEILQEYGIESTQINSLDSPPDSGTVTVLNSPSAGLNEGCVLTVGNQKLVILTDREIFGVAKQRRSTKHRTAHRNSFLSEMKQGDYVVHVEHGIGRFIGTGRSPRDDSDKEYLILEYAEHDQLYVPMDHLDRVTSYIAPMDKTPTLTRIGTQEWKRAKEKVEKATREMASELLSLYAARELAQGQCLTTNGPWQTELEDSFPFADTPDQKEANLAVKEDMERGRPMDRLICGDVGYGKTEIALRATFKAVMNGKQVAILVPTTVLAQQHYVTFSQRLRAYPVTIEVLSRFRSNREQQAVVDGLSRGTVDICIGTHRLIQEDIRFKELGMVVIDEEQRFGVAHKERLKQMRHEVDVLTLTATPIPRTLHLSLAGIRDMSIIETPPEERLPIKTYVSEFSDELIREAIRREIDRQGQVYFLHNRVHNIDYIAGYVQRLVPEATVGVAHGQMPEKQLERSMVDFAEGKFDVLACTTIIESGLDITNVNTLIVNRADTFGLAQLYQLRGRVGRGARRAYSYLLIPPSKSLTDTAEKRLRTMLEATELGAGFQIAMKDMEIRGAGNVLGAEQSGHIHAVGFDLYTRLLGEAVEEVRARTTTNEKLDLTSIPEKQADKAKAPLSDTEEIMPRVDLSVPANIPQQYIQDLSTRLNIYRRISGLESMENVPLLEEELKDRFGELPWQVRNLTYIVRLKIQAKQAGVKSISRENDFIVLRLHQDVGGAGPALQKLLGRRVHVGHTRLQLNIGRPKESWEEPLMATVERLAAFTGHLSKHISPLSSVQCGDGMRSSSS